MIIPRHFHDLPLKTQEGEGNFSIFLEWCPGAKKLQEKPITVHCPRGSLIWCKKSYVFDQTWAPLCFHTYKSNISLFSVAPSWLKMLDHECFPSAFYGSYKSVWTVHKIKIFFLAIFWSRNAIKNETAQDNRITPYFLIDSQRSPLLGQFPWRSLPENSVAPASLSPNLPIEVHA